MERKKIKTKPRLGRFCYFCNKYFPGPYQLELHIHSHTKETPFFCGDCPKGFSQPVSLRRHKIVHMSQEDKKKVKAKLKYPCTLCLQRFQGKLSLNNHISSHTKEKRFTCEFCQKRLSTKMALNAHVKLIHQNIRPFVCKECGNSFGGKRDLAKHSLIHSGIRDFPCPKCSKLFRYKSDMNKHLRTIHSSVEEKAKQKLSVYWKNACYFCGKKFRLLSRLEDHLRTHTRETPFYCDVCNQGFPAKGNIATHKRRVHISQEEKERIILAYKHQCSFCPRKCKDAATLRIHIFKHTKEKNFNCDICQKKFFTIGMLNSHLKRGHKKPKKKISKRLHCYFCEKTFPSNVRLFGHILTHTKEKPYFCSICSKGFANDGNMKVHKLNHLSEEERKGLNPRILYPCKFCHKKFRTPSNLNGHISSHTNEKPISCDICGRGFSLFTNMLQHKRIVHEKVRLFGCKECGNTFSSKGNLRRHSVVHFGNRTQDFKCSKCPKNFFSRSGLENHIDVVHLGITHHCTKCGKKFKHKAAYNRHLKNIHN